MGKITKLLATFAVMALMAVQVYAVTAYPHPVKFTQPDGTTLMVQLKGDERVHWASTLDDFTLMFNDKGYYEYAVLDGKGDMVPSGIIASDPDARNFAVQEFLSKTAKNVFYSKGQLSTMNAIWQLRNEEMKGTKAFPTTGNRKLICLLIGFKDKAFTKTQTQFNNLFNQVGYSTGSVKDYYLENSWNLFNLTVTVAGPYTASQNMSYYGANDSYGNDVKPRELVTEAVNAADATVNYADFDNDGDGSVDGVYVIYAGYGEEANGGVNCIWAHAWSIPSVVKDGKTISKYSCSAELSGSSGTTITGIGVICHEFGHVLGAPDYYDTDYSTGGQFNGTGYWDMMAAGSWNNNGVTPAHHNAYTKVKVYGWATATVLSSATTVSMNHVVGSSTSFYQINSTTSGEYWLLENRQQVGFDAQIPGHGLMIYHVHSGVVSASASNNINNTYPQKMYPVCASATTNPGTTATTYGTIDGGGCPFPGTSNKTSFTDATTPNMKSWAAANTAKPITSIVENTTAKTISFAFMGGSVTPTAPTATTSAATGISVSGATLNASVNANNATTTVTFEYGTTTSYGSTANGTPNSVTGATASSVTAALTGLAANTTYNFRVKAVNSVGTVYGSNLTFTTSSNPTSISLPVTENFTASALPSGWATQNEGTGITERWSMSNTANAGGAAYELKCAYQNLNPGTTRVITPAINTVGVSQVALSFKHLFDDYGAGCTLRVQTSNDKTNWTNTTWSLASVSNTNVSGTVNVAITSNLNSAATYIAFVVTGNLYQFDNWYIDNVSITAGTASTTPTVTTTAASSITSSGAISGGNVTADGGASVTERGICYSTSQNPTTANTKIINGTGTGSYSCTISGLAASTTYYVRAYAINSNGTSYGTQVSFTTLAGTVTYCTANSTNVTYEWIDYVGLGTIAKTSTGTAGGYSDYTSLSTNIKPGSAYTITLSAGYKSTSYTEYFNVYIDYNRDGDFSDSGELVATVSGKTTGNLTKSFTVPASASLGTTRMRVRMSDNSTTAPCGSFTYGEVEDYTVNISTSAKSYGDFVADSENFVDDIFTVYPNPASDAMSVKLAEGTGAVVTFYNIAGVEVMRALVAGSDEEINISELPAGIYTVLIDDGCKQASSKLIKR